MMRGKIVLLPFPFDDFSATKVRPALCLTDEIGPHGHVLITGLRVDSVLKVNRMMTITHSLILRELGTLSGDYLRGVEVRLRTLFRV